MLNSAFVLKENIIQSRTWSHEKFALILYFSLNVYEKVMVFAILKFQIHSLVTIFTNGRAKRSQKNTVVSFKHYAKWSVADISFVTIFNNRFKEKLQSAGQFFVLGKHLKPSMLS